MLGHRTARRLPLVPLLALLALPIWGLGAPAEAQVVRVRRGAGVAVNAPGVRVRVGPVARPVIRPRVVAPLRPLVAPVVPSVVVPRRYAPAVRVRVAPAPAVSVYGAAPAPQPQIYTSPQYASPEYASPEYASGEPEAAAQPETAAVTPDPEASPAPLPKLTELSRMEDGELLNTLVDLTARLDQRLARLTTGASWQKYLALPADALPPPSSTGEVRLGMKSLQGALDRFNTTADDPTYAKIANLDEFIAVRAALYEVVIRFGDRSSRPAQDNADESLDAPAPPAEEQPLSDEAPTDQGVADERRSDEEVTLPTPVPTSSESPGGTRSILKR